MSMVWMYLKVFLVGGALCAIGELLTLLTKLTPARILVCYILTGVVLSAVGWYGPLVKFAGAGATVPLTGFGHALCQGVLFSIQESGLIGAFTGYFGGVVDEVLMRINDALTAFPNILLALVFIAMLGFGKYNVILALGVAFIPSFARVVRAEFARHRAMSYVKSARLMGASHLRIMFRHILPNTRGVVLPALVIGFNNAVLAEASMSYLGIGVAPPDVSLGYMLSESQNYMIKAPWYVLCTGLVIVLLILGVSMMGEGLRKGGA